MANGDTFLDLHRAVGDDATAKITLNLHRRLAVLEADKRVGALFFQALRWLIGSAVFMYLVERVLDRAGG